MTSHSSRGATARDVNLWIQAQFGISNRGLPSKAMIVGYNKAHPSATYCGPGKPAPFRGQRR